jgi:carboxylesterase type B
MKNLIIINIINIVINLFTLGIKSDKIYNLTSGRYKPVKINVLNKTIYKLISVPYANIPYTFNNSVELNVNDNLSRNANKWSPLCVQPILFNYQYYGNFELPHDFDLSLNCLTINLYIPEKIDKPLSAMLFLHGGSNAAGSSSYIDASALVSIGDIIVAMPNYRLDVLGFFNTPENSDNKNTTNGNYGLWDQYLALKWLYDNCESLGCDKNAITLFGHSAGSSDTMLLSLSTLAKPYIKRIIMQSGSALAHWSFVHEKHILDEINKYVASSNQQNADLYYELIDKVEFNKTRYVNSINDTFNNFLIYSTCNLTKKHECLKEKIKYFYHFYKLNLFKIDDKLIAERILIECLKHIFDKLDLNELISLFGYMYGSLSKTCKKSHLDYVFYNKNLLDLLTSELKTTYNNQNATLLNESSIWFDSLLSRNNKLKPFDLFINDSSRLRDTKCYSDLFHFISGFDNLILVCEFLSGPFGNISKSVTGQYFLNCFHHYFADNDSRKKSKPSNYSYSNQLLDRILYFDNKLIINEIKHCYDTASTLSSDSLSSNYQRDEYVSSLIRDLSFITDNPNYLHRPTVDNVLITQNPHSQLEKFNSNNLDLLIGVTRDESFYFLLHEYNLNDIVKDTLIYSSLLNLTDNILIKLIELNKNVKLNICIRKNLFQYYKYKNLTYEYLKQDTLKNNIDLLELISDYDFLLPVITQLKSILINKDDNLNDFNNGNNKMYVYEYSHVSTINYILDYMKTFSVEFEKALKQLNNKVIPHFSELDFVFGMPILSKSNLLKTNDTAKIFNYTNDEFELSYSMIKYWINFAKYG